ncbi:small G protein signaling modulator 1-like, partial [Limulus polyphemus]|uniref:Small G protein signaling modulator 1-like n=1 Tax=Limulus polyphemus TaxID=6850 RepID=A0ABM1TND8_LIMPO
KKWFFSTAAVDACLSHGLKRRALGLFKTNSTTALLQKLAKDCDSAAVIARVVEEIEAADPNKRSSSSSDSTNKVKNPPQNSKKTIAATLYNPRYLWIRLALFNKLLAMIVDHLVKNSSKYYEKEALVADPVSGQILASLLVGPCALDYSKMKTQDHFWTDPRADELVQRHRLSSGLPLVNGSSTPPSNRRPGLQYRKDARTSGSSESEHRAIPYVARDYVESLHQNSRSTLLYGKNNVLVQPKFVLEKEVTVGSRSQKAIRLCSDAEKNHDWHLLIEANGLLFEGKAGKNIYWEFAMSFNVNDIVYLHCHQHADTGGKVVLVGQDGVQQPPIHFPKGGHLLAFLSCLENGLLPHGQLDPPLWSQRGKGKVFPKLRRKGRGSTRKRHQTSEGQALEEEEEAADYVFRIVTSLKPDSISQEMMDPKTTRGSFPWQSGGRAARLKHLSSSSSSTSSSKSLAEDNVTSTDVPKSAAPIPKKPVPLPRTSEAEESASAGESIQVLCNTMRRQIISRAFYGWLAHCRHLRTVRTHLSGLVNATIVSDTEPTHAASGLTSEVWMTLQENDCVKEASEIYRLTYFGGIEHSIRKEVWPYLLGHYQFGSTAEERKKHDNSIQTAYETTMSEWLAVEAIVRQQDKEVMEANMAKLSSESTNSEIPLVGPKDANLNNEVFEDISPSESFEEHDEKSDIRKGSEEAFSSFEEHYPKTEGAESQPVTLKYVRGRLIRHYQVDSQSQSIIITNPSVDINGDEQKDENDDPKEGDNEPEDDVEFARDELLPRDYGDGDSQLSADSRSSCISPASSSGGVYSMELLDQFSLNLHRIEKDVQRCDRNYWYFRVENLEKLRNVMCTYVWEHLDVGYVQGMCDLVAPLLVIFDDEVLTYSCFCELMKRMAANFPHGGAMDAHFANMRSLIQILDGEMFELMHKNGDYTHFYFCYRWFLLDFKRELVYDDIFSVWETIWAAKPIASSHLVLFIALAMVEYYRDIILENNMDFTDIIKFFNEMAERHDAKAVLKVARELVHQIQTLIDNK